MRGWVRLTAVSLWMEHSICPMSGLLANSKTNCGVECSFIVKPRWGSVTWVMGALARLARISHLPSECGLVISVQRSEFSAEWRGVVGAKRPPSNRGANPLEFGRIENPPFPLCIRCFLWLFLIGAHPCNPWFLFDQDHNQELLQFLPESFRQCKSDYRISRPNRCFWTPSRTDNDILFSIQLKDRRRGTAGVGHLILP